MNNKDTLVAIRRIEQFYRRAVREIIADVAPLTARFARTDDPVRFEERLSLAYAPIEPGVVWGQTWQSAWFHLRGTVPAAWRGRTVVAQLDLGGEGLVVRPDGQILQGITNGSVFDTEFGRDIVRLYDSCAGGEEVELWVEGAANGLFGMFCDLDPGIRSTNRYGQYDARVNCLHLGIFDTIKWELTLDLRVLIGLVKALPEQSVRRARLIRAAFDGLNEYARSGENAAAYREALRDVLSRPAESSMLTVTAVGHAHIDTAWLWPVRESVRKCARTFATQLELMERYPDYIFGASQAQHYAFVKEHYPELYQRIKKAVSAGRWEVQGGMWVEADCNVTSGESLVRQLLHGKNFFRDEFGVEVDNLWLPDVFGYSAALPQILRKSGIPYFLTQKMSWNQINDFPYHTFRWQGIDGSEVVAHFPPENTYNSQLHSESLVAAQERFKEKGILDEFLCLFGVGDGGGGPKEEHIRMGQRMANLEGAPRIRFGTARDFFHRLGNTVNELPTWVGELYLELHRGTLTTQGFVKWANRRLEHKLRALEMLASATVGVDCYPSTELDGLWKTVLLNQFHDIIPGSSIWRVYRVTQAEYRDALKKCDDLATRLATDAMKPRHDAVTLFNSLHCPYTGAVKLPKDWDGHDITDDRGAAVPIQSEEGGPVALVNVPPYSFATLTRAQKAIAPKAMPSGLTLENDLVRFDFDESGRLVGGEDKTTGVAFVSPDHPANVLTLYEDRPNDWDAWDVDAFYRQTALESAKAIVARPLVSGPVRQGIAFEYRIGASTIIQRVYLTAGSRRLDFETTVDWHEKHKMLRVAFPVNIRTEQATFDIQYGYLKRPTHHNTSWEQARFEAVGHRYADLSDGDYGVALLNDSKYGYYVRDGLLDLNLLRSPNYPDPDADQGEHQFVYSLLPHRGDVTDADVIAEAAKLNQGILAFEGRDAGGRCLPVEVSGDGVSLEVLKKAEQEPALVVRMIETRGRQALATVRLKEPGWQMIETDLMERPVEGAPIHSGTVEVHLRPFDIRTFKLFRADT